MKKLSKKNIILGVIILIPICLLIISYFVGKIERERQLNQLGLTTKDVTNFQNELKSYEEDMKSDDLTEEESLYFENNGVKKDKILNLYNVYDKDWQPVVINFKKTDGKWYWKVVLSGEWNDINSTTFVAPNSIYNGYKIKTDKVKNIFKKLSGKEDKEDVNLDKTKKIDYKKAILDTVQKASNVDEDGKYTYSLYENPDGTYTFLGHGASASQTDEIKKLAESKGINFENVKIVRANTDELVYKKNVELLSKNPTKMIEFFSLLKEGGDIVDRDNKFNTIYKYYVSKENLEKYSEQVAEIKAFGNIELIEK